MMFNPLFIQNNNPNNTNENSKQTKPSSPTYLFSDIIRLLNDSSTNQNVSDSSETIPDSGKNNLTFPLSNKNLINNDETEIINHSELGIIIEETFADNAQTITKEEINFSDSLNLISPKIDLAASLEKIIGEIPETEFNLNNVELLNNLAAQYPIKNEKGNNEINIKGNLINPLENIETQASNFNLLSSAALNFNDKQQLLIKVFDSENDQNISSEKTVASDKDSLDIELEKITSLLFGLLSQQNSLPADNVNQQESFDSVTAKTINTQNIYPLDTNVKDTILSHLNSNEPLILNITLGGENLKIEITSEPVGKIDNEVIPPDTLPDTKTFLNSEPVSNEKVDISTENNSLKNLLPEIKKETLKKSNIENLTTIKSNEINPEFKTESLKLKPSKKFTLKITQETVHKNSNSINALKEMLQNMGVDEKIEIKVLTPENKPILKTEAQQIGDLLSKDNNTIVKTNKSLSDSNQTSQNIINQKTQKVNGKINTTDNVSGELVESIDNFIRKSPESKKEVKKTDVNSNKTITDTQNKKVVADITETSDKDPEQKPSSDKKEIFNLKSTVNQTNAPKAESIKSEATQNIFKMFGENNTTVKASNLLNEISRFFEKGESKSIVIKLKPDTLGKVKIVLDVVDKIVHANIQVNNESVKQMVQNNIDTLIQNLNLSGLQLSSFNVSLNNNENKESKTNSQKKKYSNSRFNNKISEDNESINTKSMGYNTYDFLI